MSNNPIILPTGEYDTPSTVYSTHQEEEGIDARAVCADFVVVVFCVCFRFFFVFSTFSNTIKEETTISLVVRVPVLSLQITDTQPSVSTEGKFRTMTFRCAIRRVPRLRHNVITAGKPSGMAATPKATATLV